MADPPSNTPTRLTVTGVFFQEDPDNLMDAWAEVWLTAAATTAHREVVPGTIRRTTQAAWVVPDSDATPNTAPTHQSVTWTADTQPVTRDRPPAEPFRVIGPVVTPTEIMGDEAAYLTIPHFTDDTGEG